MGRPRSLPPKTDICQAAVGMAARFGDFLTLSPDRYGPRSANLALMAPCGFPPISHCGIVTTSAMSSEARTALSFSP